MTCFRLTAGAIRMPGTSLSGCTLPWTMGRTAERRKKKSPHMCRPLNRDQVERLLTILRDNGIEPDECFTVAEAICFVTDRDTTILEEVAP